MSVEEKEVTVLALRVAQSIPMPYLMMAHDIISCLEEKHGIHDRRSN
jgi:hypothetical protein